MPQAFVYKHVTATGVTTVSISNFGMLHGIVLNQVSTAASSTSLLTVYDATTTLASTSPFVIGIEDTTRSGVGEYIYDCEYVNGITISIGGGAAPVDLTVLYT